MSVPRRFSAWLADERGLSRVAALLGALLVLVYIGMPAEELTFDNAFIIGEDIRLRSLSAETLGRIFTNDYWWPTMASNLYRPLTTLSFLVEHSVLGFGKNPLGYQLVNLVLHWGCGLLLYLLARRLGLGPLAGLLSSALFVAHPVTTEVVANIVGRSDLFATLAVLGGLLFWLQSRSETDPARRRICLFRMGACGLGGMFAKESSVVLPAVVAWAMVVEAYGKAGVQGVRAMFRERENWLAGAAFLPAVAVFFFARHHFSSFPGVNDVPFVDNPIATAGFLEGKATALAVWGMQLASYALPLNLSSDYSFNVIEIASLPWGNATAAWAWATLAVFVGIAAAIPTLLRRSPHTVFALGAYALCMLPTANLLIPIGSIRADRFHYLPSAFLVLAAAGVAGLLWRGLADKQPRLRVPLCATGIAWAMSLAVLAHFRCYDWRNNLTLWSSVYAVVPKSVKAVGSYSSERASARADAESYWAGVRRLEDYIENTLRETEAPPRKWAIMLYSDLGSYLVSLYDDAVARGVSEAERTAILTRALSHLETGIRLENENVAKMRERWSEAEVPNEPRLELLHRNYSTALRRDGRNEEAERVLRRAVGFTGFKLGPRMSLFETLASIPKAEEAIGTWMVICLIDPSHQDKVEVVGELIRSLHPESTPLQVAGDGRSALRLSDKAVLTHLKRAVETYAAELRQKGLEVQAARLERSARIKYGFVFGDLVQEQRGLQSAL